MGFSVAERDGGVGVVGRVVVVAAKEEKREIIELICFFHVH